MDGADPYEVLGVAKSASQKEIQAAFRKLAKQHHPDLHPDDKGAQSKFQDASAAYDILGDEEKRGRFDRGEIDASGGERPQRQYYKDFAGGPENDGYGGPAGYDAAADPDDILASMFSRRARQRFRMRGPDRRFQLEVDFLDAINGATNRVVLPDGSTLDVAIRAGTTDGQTLRLKGKGEPGAGGGEAGDALIEIKVLPHPLFVREGDDIRLELPISLTEAVAGGTAQVPTPTGPVAVTIPPGSNTGKTLRLRGKGAARRDGGRGDEYLTLKVVLPDQADPELSDFVARWQAGKAFNPRGGMNS